MHIIGFVGRRRSGKDTAALALIEYGYVLVKFADPLKNMLRNYLAYVGADSATIERMIEGDQKETPSRWFGGKTCRHAMQTLGTEWGRDLINNNLWVDAAISRARQLGNVVISDVRFLNEAAAIRAAGGTLIKLMRDSGNKDGHASEAFTDDIPVDYTIFNDTSIEQLHTAIRKIINDTRKP